MRRRQPAEPPTESYAETRAVQVLRRFGHDRIWRQFRIRAPETGQILSRVDLVLPARPKAGRPQRLVPADGLLIEVDGREPHTQSAAFEHDRRRHNELGMRGYKLYVATPEVIERQPRRFRADIESFTQVA